MLPGLILSTREISPFPKTKYDIGDLRYLQ